MKKLSQILYKQRFAKRKEISFYECKRGEFYVIADALSDCYAYVKFVSKNSISYKASLKIKIPSIINKKEIEILSYPTNLSSFVFSSTKVYKPNKKDAQLIKLILREVEKEKKSMNNDGISECKVTSLCQFNIKFD